MTSVAGTPAPKLVGNYTLLRELGAREVPTYAARFSVAEPLSRQAAEQRASDAALELVVLERYVSEAAGEREHALAHAAQEAESLTEVVHPNLARVRAVMSTSTDVLVASDFVEGETYADLTKSKDAEGRLPFRARLSLLLDVLGGLSALHAVVQGDRHRVHGEVAPENVVVGVDGSARLVRVCNLFPEQVSPASPNLGFIAPELVQGAAGTALVDARVDLYGAGVLLWEILTGKRLFVQSNSSALLLYELDHGPPRGIPAEDLPWAKSLIDVTKRALAPSAERWSSAADMAAAVREICEPLSERLPSAGEIAQQVSRLAGSKIAARRERLYAHAPRPANEARPSIASKTGSRPPRSLALSPPTFVPQRVPVPKIEQPFPAPPPLNAPAAATSTAPAPAPVMVRATAPAPAPPMVTAPTAAPAHAPSTTLPVMPLVADGVNAPRVTPNPLHDLSGSIVFPLQQRRRRGVVWAVAGAALLLLVGVAGLTFAGKEDASSPTGAASGSVPAGGAASAPAPLASASSAPSATAPTTEIELVPDTTSPSGRRVRKRRPTPPPGTKKRFEPQGI